jgi:hypothetical protein
MSAPSASPTPLISPAEMQVLVSRAGLMLNPGQMADLVLAWRQVARLLALIPRDRPLADDQACVFRLPLPVAKPAGRPRPADRSAKQPPARSANQPSPRKAARRKR